MTIGRDGFLGELAATFPDTPWEVGRHSKGLLHCEVATFREMTESAMNEGRAWRAQQHFRFVERMLLVADPALENALEISYLEDLALGEHTPERYRIVKERMPLQLRERMIVASEFWR